jgi:hypothetical protein
VAQAKLQTNKKGFLFVLTVFLILTYILLSVSVWVKAIEASESSYSEFYKESNVELAVSQITNQKVDAVSYLILNRALDAFNNQSIDHPFAVGSTGDENHYIAAAFGEWLENGTPSQSDFADGVAPSEPTSSLAAWASSLNASLAATGVTLDYFKVTDFTITQTDIDTLSYSFNATLRMSDKSGTTSVDRTYHISNALSSRASRTRLSRARRSPPATTRSRAGSSSSARQYTQAPAASCPAF